MPLFISEKRIKKMIGQATTLAVQSINANLPEKVFIDKTADGYYEYSDVPPGHIDKFYDALHGYYGRSNFVELFYCLPEVFAPIHEIASRVAEANWQLIKEWNDEIDWNDATFNQLFSQPNPLQTHKQLIYMAVVYEILTGANYFYMNDPGEEIIDLGEHYKNVINWWNLSAGCVEAKLNKNIDPYSITEISDLVLQWQEVNYWTGGRRGFDSRNVVPIQNLSLERPFDLNCRKALILGADKPIKNLLPVYEARGVIFIKRGAMGFFVSKKSDETGMQSLTKSEREEANKEFNGSYGLTGDKDTFGVAAAPLEFIRTAMSIQELQPFDETLADAVAIYAVLRVPRHLVPSKDKSTFNNAAADMLAFYVDTIIPWANKYAQAFTNYFKIPRRYIKADFSHVQHLQEDRKVKSSADNMDGETWLTRWQSGACCLNDWITAIDGTKGTGPLFEKKLPEMTPEELIQVKAFVSLTQKQQQEKTDKKKKDGTTNDTPKTD